MKDPIVQQVIEKYKERSEAGIRKYGTTLNRDDFNLLDWLQHLQEELMDATLYIEAIFKQASEHNNNIESAREKVAFWQPYDKESFSALEGTQVLVRTGSQYEVCRIMKGKLKYWDSKEHDYFPIYINPDEYLILT